MWQSWTILLQAFRMYRDVFHMLLHDTCKPMKNRWKNYLLLSVSVILHLAPWCQSLPAAWMKNTKSYLKWEQREWQKHILFEKGFRCLFFFCHIWEVLIKKHGCLKRGQDKESQAITLFSSDRLAKEGLFWHTEKYLKGSKDHSKKWNDMVVCIWWEESGFEQSSLCVNKYASDKQVFPCGAVKTTSVWMLYLAGM